MPKTSGTQNTLKQDLSEAAGRWLDIAEKVKKLPDVNPKNVSSYIVQADEAMQAVEDLVGAL